MLLKYQQADDFNQQQSQVIFLSDEYYDKLLVLKEKRCNTGSFSIPFIRAKSHINFSMHWSVIRRFLPSSPNTVPSYFCQTQPLIKLMFSKELSKSKVK